MAQDALTAQAEIARLKFQLARYRRAEFGRSSEQLAREAEQLELALEALESDQAERLATASPAVAAAVETAVEAHKPARRPLPEHLPSEDRRRRCSLWWMPSPSTSWPATLCMSTTRRCRFWRQVPARPRPAGCGPPLSRGQALCPRSAAIRRFAPAGGAVLLLGRSQRRASAGPSEGLSRRHSRRRLCRVQRTIHRRPHCRGRLLGACAAQIL